LGIEDPLEVLRLVDFHQRGHPQLDGRTGQLVELPIVEAFGDQQDGVGARSAGLVELIDVQDKVFAEDR
jgi:hypothetical protein